jgi:hypothetical protein
MPLRFETTLCEGLLMELPHWLMVVGALFLVLGPFRPGTPEKRASDGADDAEMQSGLAP